MSDVATDVRPKRMRVEIERFDPIKEKAAGDDVSYSGGKGDSLGSIDHIAEQLGKSKDEDTVKILHNLCYDRTGKKTIRKKSIRAFTGWTDESLLSSKTSKLATNKKITITHLKGVCNILGIMRSGTKDDLAASITEFLQCPSSDAVTTTSTLTKKRKASTGSSTKKKARTSKGGKGDKKDGEKKKRPPSAYLLFCAAAREGVVADLDESSPPTEVMKRLGELWRGLSKDKKATYQKKALKAKEQMASETPSPAKKSKAPKKIEKKKKSC